MSQVIRKFENSGKIEQSKPELFERSGVGKYNKADLVAGLYRNIDTYIKNNNLSGDKAVSFRDSANQFIKGIENGTISMNGDGTFSDATGSMASTGKFDKNWIGRKKDTTNNAFNLVGDYALDYINQMQQYTEPAAKSKFNTNDFLTKEISKRWYGGNDIDFGNWFKNRSEQDRNALLGDIFNNADYNQLYQDYDWTDTGINSAEDLATRGRAFSTAISNNTLDNDDYNTFATLGGTGLDKFIRPTQQATTPQSSTVEGQQGKVDTSWTNSEYDRTVDDKGKYHIYKKGTNEEVSGILPGNVFKGVGNRYAFDGNIYDDSNLPEQYRQDITRARQAQLGEYTSLTDNNPFTKMLKGQGYNYITNLSQFVSGVGNNVLYGAYSNPSDVNGKMGFYLKNPTTGKTTRGSVELNKSLGEYQFIGEDGNVINLGAYNPNGARERQGVKFVDYTDTSKANWENLFNTWMQDPDLLNPASEAYRMVQNTLSKWIDSKQSPFVKYGKNYKWAVGDNDMNVARNNDGTLSWYFNNKVESEDESSNELRRLLSIPTAERSREINDRILKLQGYKKGGVISAQLGTKFIEDTTPLKVSAVQPDAEQIERNTKARQSFTGRSNVSLGNNKDITDAGGVIKTSDKVRLGAAMADLASIGLGFVPGANLASAGVGVGASLAEFGADLASDGPQWGDLGRLGVNLGMDALSLIPVGKTLKATKALGKIKKSIPVLMTLINTTPYLDPAIRSEYSKTLSKLTKGDIKSLNTGDFKNLSAIASTVLMGKNLAQSHRGWWNSSTTPSGKRRVTAMIDGKQQTLEVDDAFFQNTKGKNQVAELKTKFAEQYNKANKLEGDKAIKPESVSVDTKYFGRRPQSEEVEGTKTDGNWFSNSLIGKHIAGYRDPSVVRGSENIPFSDAWFLKRRGSAVPNASTTQLKGKDRDKDKNTPPLLMLPAPGQTNRVFHMGASKPRVPQDVTNPSKLKKPGSYTDRAVPVGGTPVQSPNAKAVRTINSVSSILEPFVPKPKNLPAIIPVSRNANKVVASQTIQPTQRLDQFIEGQIPGGRQFGRQRAKTEGEYRDVFHPVVEREQNTLWDQLTSTPEYRNRLILTNQPQGVQAGPTAPIDLFTETQKNVRKSLQVSESRKERSRNNALPHKPKPKKKKTSKDDRVTKKAEGGIVQFLQGGNTVGRIKAKDMSNWNRANALANYDWIADYDRWASQHEGPDDVVDSYILAFNGGEDIYDQLTSKTGDYFGGKYNYSVQDPLAKHRQITFRGTNQGFDDLIRKGIVGYGTTEGNSGFDIYAGDRTGNRTLARGMSPEDVARFNKQLATRGMELYDKGNGAYRLRRLEQKPVELPEVVVTADTPATTNPSAIKGAAPKKGKGFNLGVMPEDVIALGRMVGGLAANNRAAKLYKEGLKPTLLDTFENTVPLQGNFQATTNAEQQAGNLESVAARPRTSDASLQLAGELEASGRAGQARFQGGLQDAEMFYKTRMLGQQESDAAKARRVDVANRNRASMNQIDAAKKQIDAARVTSNYQNVIAPYLAGVENQFAQKRAMNQQLDMEEAQREAERTYSPEFDRLTQDYNNAYKAYGAANNNNYTGWETSNEYKSLVSRRKSLNDNVSQFLLDKRRGIMGSPYMFQVKKNSSIKTPYVKSGGKLSAADREKLQRAKDFNKRLLEDNKQFHKDIMESKREHNKLIMSMSSLTSELIKKAMS
mgnify:FL=1